MRLTIESLRKALESSPEDPEGNTWVHKLPLAMFYLNDLPGAYTPYSPHYLVFGRNPIGLGEIAPIEVPSTCVDAETWHRRHMDLCKLVQAKVTKTHGRLSAKASKHFREISYNPGDRVWVRNLPDGKDKGMSVDSKLDILWTGPCEVLQHKHQGRYLISHPHTGEADVYIDRLRPYIPPLEGDSIPLHYHAPAHIPSERDDRWVIKKILGHKKSGNKLMWKVLWEAGDVTWEKASQFMHGIQSDWAAYNKKNNIQVLAEI